MPRLDRPPRWGVLSLVALSAGNAAVFGYLALRSAAAESDPEPRAAASALTPMTWPAPASSGRSQPVMESEKPTVIAVYGDGYTAGSEAGGLGGRNWTALLEADLRTDVRPFAVSMSGYAAEGLTGETFAELAGANPVADADLVVVFGSRNDLGEPVDAVAEGAAATFATFRGSAPGAEILVIGPAWSNATPPPGLAEVSQAVRDAAADAGATFVDPLAEGWFAAPEGLIAADGISPTDAGHADLAERVAPLVEQVLSQDD